MKKVIIIAAIVGLLGALVAPVAFNSIRYRMNPLAAALIPLMDGTEWSPNYSYSKFRKVHVGMTTNDALNILGPCLAVTHYKDDTQWHYTRGKDGRTMSSSVHSTHFRIVSFGPDSLVSGKTYTFYFD
jgi:hypothetical protein